MRRVVGVALAIGLAGACTPTQKGAGGDAGSGACKRVGDACEIAPGKLGSCVAKDDCAAGGACFVCQSQH